MSFNPFQNNPNYTQLFCVRNFDRCDNAEVVELYKHKSNDDHVLYRYKQDEGQFPLKVVIKFTTLLHYEVLENCGNVSLFITVCYKNNNATSHRFTACSGSKVFVYKVEIEIIKYLF